jgi:hypothetical protein
VATKVSFVASNQPFVDRLDTFPIARLLEITLVLLVFVETHYLLDIHASLGRELTQCGFRCVQIAPFLMQKSDPRGKSRVATKLPSVALCESFMDRMNTIFIDRHLKNTLVLLLFCRNPLPTASRLNELPYGAASVLYPQND